MGYQIISPPNTNTQPVGIGISYVPWQGGPFTPIITTNDQAIANLKNLLLTRVGERYGYPTYGTFLLNAIFQPNVSDIKQEIKDLIQPKISEFLPGIRVESIDIMTAEDDPNLIHDVEVRIKFSVNNLNQNQMTIGANEDGTMSITTNTRA